METTLGEYVVGVATDFGPRITGLRRVGGPEMLVTLPPDVALERGGMRFVFRGGHRLWAAPENPEVSYAPDDHACRVEHDDGGLRISAPPDSVGLVKELEVAVEGEWLVVGHRLSAVPGVVLKVAPWAISQVPPGGRAILGFAPRATKPLPDRHIVLWPYTELTDRRISVREDAVVVAAEGADELKVGVGPDPGRVAYLRSGWAFVKEIPPAGERNTPDFGAVGQVYVGQGFCEMESVGEIGEVNVDSPLSLVERWMVLECPDLATAVRLVVEGPE